MKAKRTTWEKAAIMAVWILSLHAGVSGQVGSPDTLLAEELVAVTVQASRLPSQDLSTPLAISRLGSYRLRHGQQGLSLEETLTTVPGLFVQNGNNFAQDVRISIRGFGARSAFGIRGIRMLLDGFPETSPDGQGQVDNIDPALLSDVEVVRGNTGGYYGNASGGMIRFTSLDFEGPPRTEAGVAAGAYGFRKALVRSQGRLGANRVYAFNGMYAGTNGYRNHAAFRNYLGNAGMQWKPDRNNTVRFLANISFSPQADDPGALTIGEYRQDRRQARERNVAFDAGESVRQGRLGISWLHQFRDSSQLDVRIFKTFRVFDSRLAGNPAEVVRFDRSFRGSAMTYQRADEAGRVRVRTLLGMEAEAQTDHRRRYVNNGGIRGGLKFDQDEVCAVAAIYLSQEYEMGDRWGVYPGIRTDYLRLQVNDRFLSDGDDSGERDYLVANPFIGLRFRLSRHSTLYANAGSGFETPTFTEYANPSGIGGFNPGLQPQRSRSVELGWKGAGVGNRLKYDVAIFRIRLRDELVPVEIDARTFYENAARSLRRGLEAGCSFFAGSGIYLFANLTVSRFEFQDYRERGRDYQGNRQPGVPLQTAYLALRYHHRGGLFLTLRAQQAGRMYADNANSTEVSGYRLLHANIACRLSLDSIILEPSFGINNVWGEPYFSNIRTNGFGGRYYEPAPPVHVYGGVKFLFGD
ncbi:MAG: hypothetical protein RLY31_3110 [Bacteroidota bacterium]